MSCTVCGSSEDQYEVGNTGLLRCPDCFATTHPEKPKPKSKGKKE